MVLLVFLGWFAQLNLDEFSTIQLKAFSGAENFFN